MTEPRSGLTWRPERKLRQQVEDFAARTHRSMAQAMTALIESGLATELNAAVPVPRSQDST
jgi:hypothetical protein